MLDAQQTHSLNLAHNLLSPRQALHHLLTLFAAANGVVALFEELVEFRRFIHVLEEFPLHFFLSVSVSLPSV